MAITDYKIKSSEIAPKQVQSKPDTLTGTAQDNKKVFDELPNLIIEKFNAMLEGLEKAIQIPIGGLFISTLETNPSTMLGYGTWEQYAQGRTLIGQGNSDTSFANQEIGGQSAPTMPAHSVPPTSANSTPGSYEVAQRLAVTAVSAGGTYNTPAFDVAGIGDPKKGNLPPYIATYIWKRTA